MQREWNIFTSGRRLPLATATAPRIDRFSSDHRSQARLRVASTWMGDRLGTPRAVAFLQKLTAGRKGVCIIRRANYYFC